MPDLRVRKLLLTGQATLVTETCYKCGVLFRGRDGQIGSGEDFSPYRDEEVR